MYSMIAVHVAIYRAKRAHFTRVATALRRYNTNCQNASGQLTRSGGCVGSLSHCICVFRLYENLRRVGHVNAKRRRLVFPGINNDTIRVPWLPNTCTCLACCIRIMFGEGSRNTLTSLFAVSQAFKAIRMRQCWHPLVVTYEYLSLIFSSSRSI